MRMEKQWLRMMMLNCFGTFDHYFINILIDLNSITVAHEKKRSNIVTSQSRLNHPLFTEATHFEQSVCTVLVQLAVETVPRQLIVIIVEVQG